MIEPAGAALSWLGACLMVLADGRRGLALGIFVVASGLAALVSGQGQQVEGTLIAAGGLVSALQRWRSGPPGWKLMPPGSTPGLVLCLGTGLLALWVGAAVTTGPGASLRTAVLAVVGMCAVRLLSTDEPAAMCTAIAGVVLGVAGASLLGGGAPDPVMFAAAALAVAASSFVTAARPRGNA